MNKAIFLMGPTAVGKTELALNLATIYPIEIISVDSALIYRELDIGSAKPTLAERKQVPHHLIDILSPLASYSVANFLIDCNRAVAAINARGKIPLLVGGTMMYYNALINGISELPVANNEMRAVLVEEVANLGLAALYQRLVKLDPLAAAKIASTDRQRILRALEVCILTGKPLSQVQLENKQAGIVACDYLALAIVPSNRELLQQRINLRLQQMLAAGFIDEVIGLQRKYSELTAMHNSMRTVGYRQVWQYLANAIDFPTLLTTAQAATRQLAKRQITWLRSMPVVALDDSLLSPTILGQKISQQINKFY